MINKKLFISELGKIAIINSIEPNNQYLAIMYEELNKLELDDKSFLSSVEKIKMVELYGKMPTLAMFAKIKKENEPAETDAEKQAGIEFNKVLLKIRLGYVENLDKTTEEVLKLYYENGLKTIEWMLYDPYNDNKTDLKWARKEFIDYWLDCYDKKEQDQKITAIDFKKQNLINN